MELVARPAGFEPATFGSGGYGREATRGGANTLPLCFRGKFANPRQPATAPSCIALSLVCPSSQTFRRAPLIQLQELAVNSWGPTADSPSPSVE
jgi:hypothetical protein